MPHSFPNNGNGAEFVGQTPWSAPDALVPRPEQRYQHPAKQEQADGGVGRSPGRLPHDQCRCAVVRKLCVISLNRLPYRAAERTAYWLWPVHESHSGYSLGPLMMILAAQSVAATSWPTGNRGSSNSPRSSAVRVELACHSPVRGLYQVKR